MGRKDFQTKIRGHGVEMSAVEMALRGIEGIKQAAVVSIGDTGIASYYTLLISFVGHTYSGLMELGTMQPNWD
jgi:hypothetical protein